MISHAVLAAAALIASPAGTATIQGANVCLSTPAQPGHSYPATVYVQDKSRTAETLDVTAGPLWPGQQLYHGEHDVPESWVRAGDGPVTLQPGRGLTVPVTITIPQDAAPGIYAGNVTVQTAGAPASAADVQAILAASAQTFLIFSVSGPQPSCQTPPPAGAAWLPDWSPRQPQEQTVTMAWLRAHLPWVFGAKAKASQAQAGTGSGASTLPAGAKLRLTAKDADSIIAIVLLGALAAGCASLRKRRIW